jgi:hypothetical protein
MTRKQRLELCEKVGIVGEKKKLMMRTDLCSTGHLLLSCLLYASFCLHGSPARGTVETAVGTEQSCGSMFVCLVLICSDGGWS